MERSRVCVVLDKECVLGWSLWLINALRVRHDVAISLMSVPNAVRMPAACWVAFELERLVYGVLPGSAIERIKSEAISPLTDFGSLDAFDVVINCAGLKFDALRAPRTLTVLVDGLPAELGALSALLDNRPISIVVEDSHRPGRFAAAIPGIADRRVLTHALDNICSVAIDLLIKTLEQDAFASRTPQAATHRPRPWSTASLRYVAVSLIWKVNRLLSLRLVGREQWSVAYRHVRGASLMKAGSAGFTLLPDEGRQYYADPFLIEHLGRSFLFMEEFLFETGLGRIVVAEMKEGGATRPRPVLEEAYHLSYPNVFVYGGEVWMIPESGANACVDLYRAVEFPFRWRREARLLTGVIAYDATLLRVVDGWWMFAATRNFRATGWDSLSVFCAPDLQGPWRPCASNPLVLDARASRPAGNIISTGDAHLRPVQNCEAFYGAGINLFRVDRLDPGGFEQAKVAEIGCEDFGVHTYNAVGAFEVVDAFGRMSDKRSLTVRCTGNSAVGFGTRSAERGVGFDDGRGH